MDTGVFCGYSTTKQKVMIRTCLLDFSTLCYVLLPASVTRGRNLFRLAPFTMLVYAGWADPDITSVHAHVASLSLSF